MSAPATPDWFDAEGLRANRAGHMSARQRNRVHARQRALLHALALLTALAVMLAAVAILGLLPAGEPVSAPAIILALGGEALGVALAWFTWTRWQRFRARLAPGLVQSISGPVTCYALRERRAAGSGARPGYYVRVAEREFAVPHPALASFADGAVWTLYFVERPLALLSAEPTPVVSPA